MNIQERCGKCTQPAEVICDCQEFLCTQCIYEHDSKHPDFSVAYSPLERRQNLIVDDGFCRHFEEVLSMAEEVNSSVDIAVNSLQALRQPLLVQLEKARMQYLDALRQDAMGQRSLEIHREAEAVLGNFKEAIALIIEHSVNVQQSVVSLVSLQVPGLQRSGEWPALDPGPADLLYCVKSKANEIYAFNPTTETMGEIPIRCEKRLAMNGSYCFVPPARLYYCGGKNRTSEVASWLLISLDTGRAISSGPMKVQRVQHAVVHVSSKVFIFGGYASGSLLDSCEKFDVAYSNQSLVASMSQKLDKIGAAVVQQNVYITGYRKRGEQVGQFIEVYDTTMDCFFTIPFQLPTNSCSIGFAVDNCLGFLRAASLLTYDLRSGSQQHFTMEPQTYVTCTSPVAYNLKVYYIVSTEEKYTISCLNWQTKKSRVVGDLTQVFL